MELPDLFAMPSELMDVDTMELIERHELTENADGEPLGVDTRRAVVRFRLCDARKIDECQQ